MRRFWKITLLSLAFLVLWPAPQAEAVDPVTVAVLAPVALKVASVAMPYVVRGLANGAKCLFYMGKDILEIFYLPLGMGQALFLGPWGGLKPGCVKMIKGCIAPGKLVLHTLLLPVMLVGVNVNI
jgi:hypothetical protein